MGGTPLDSVEPKLFPSWFHCPSSHPPGAPLSITSLCASLHFNSAFPFTDASPGLSRCKASATLHETVSLTVVRLHRPSSRGRLPHDQGGLPAGAAALSPSRPQSLLDDAKGVLTGRFHLGDVDILFITGDSSALESQHQLSQESKVFTPTDSQYKISNKCPDKVFVALWNFMSLSDLHHMPLSQQAPTFQTPIEVH